MTCRCIVWEAAYRNRQAGKEGRRTLLGEGGDGEQEEEADYAAHVGGVVWACCLCVVCAVGRRACIVRGGQSVRGGEEAGRALRSDWMWPSTIQQ